MPIRFHVAVRDEPCGSCHVEHARRSELNAPRRAFSHDLIPQRLREDCRPCHSGAAVPEHSRTDSVECRKCHEVGTFAGSRPAHDAVAEHHCDACHVPPDDERHLNLAGTCSTCHGVEQWVPVLKGQD